MMRLILLIFLIGLTQCSPERRINWIVKHHPELAESKTETVHDTLRVPGEKRETEFKTVMDSSRFDSLLHEFAKVQSMLSFSTDPEVVAEKEKQIQRLKRQIIKTIWPDTTYNIKYTQAWLYGGVPINMETSIKLRLHDGTYSYSYSREPINIPYVKSETTQKIDARVGKPFFKIWWFWLFVVSLIWIFRYQIWSLAMPLVSRIRRS